MIIKVCYRLFFPLFILLSAAARADVETCPAISCDCEAFSDHRWTEVCRMQEGEIKAECAASGGVPQTYCRLAGPSAFPVALTMTPQTISRFETLDPELQHETPELLLERIGGLNWSLQEDLTFVEGRASSGHQLLQLAEPLENAIRKLFALQSRQLSAFSDYAPTARTVSLAAEYSSQWRTVSERLNRLSNHAFGENTPIESSSNGQAALKYSRLAAICLEIDGLLLAQTGNVSEAAHAWQLAAGIAEQTVTRAAASGAPERFASFYRAQAASRWSRATFYWLEAGNYDDADVSLQNFAQVIDDGRLGNAVDVGVAGTGSSSLP